MPQFDKRAPGEARLLASAAEFYRMRRERDRIMPEALVGEPAWDMLLALYAEEPSKLPVSSLCYGSGVPRSTALRWISALEKTGLIERTTHPRDERLILISLTGNGRDVVERSLTAMLEARDRQPAR